MSKKAKELFKEQRFGIRKFTLGAASIVIGTTFYLANDHDAQAAEIENDANVSTETTSNNTPDTEAVKASTTNATDDTVQRDVNAELGNETNANTENVVEETTQNTEETATENTENVENNNEVSQPSTESAQTVNETTATNNVVKETTQNTEETATENTENVENNNEISQPSTKQNSGYDENTNNVNPEQPTETETSEVPVNNDTPTESPVVEPEENNTPVENEVSNETSQPETVNNEVETQTPDSTETGNETNEVAEETTVEQPAETQNVNETTPSNENEVTSNNENVENKEETTTETPVETDTNDVNETNEVTTNDATSNSESVESAENAENKEDTSVEEPTEKSDVDETTSSTENNTTTNEVQYEAPVNNVTGNAETNNEVATTNEADKEVTAPVLEANDYQAYVGQYFDPLADMNFNILESPSDEAVEVNYTKGYDLTKEGKYPITFTAKTSGGSESSITRNLSVVVSPEKPVIYAPNKTVKKGSNYNILDDVSASDKQDGNLTSRVMVINDGGFDPNVAGIYDVEYKVTDKNGNDVIVTRRIIVSDEDVPTIETPESPETIERKEIVPFEKEERVNPDKPADYAKVIHKGVDGERLIIETIENGKSSFDTKWLKEVENEIIEVGTGERTTETEERTEPVAFGVDKRPTTEIPVGETRVVSEGKNGEDKIIVEQDYINGKPYGTPREKRVHITPPVNQVVEYGVEKDAPIEPENPSNPAETPNENPDNNNPENPDVNVDNPSTNNPSDKMDQELPNPDKPLETDKDKHDVDGGVVNVDKGGKITESDIKDAVKVKDYPKDKGEPLVIVRDKKQIPDTAKTGSYGVSVTVKFPDGSTTETVVKVNVTEKTDKDVDKETKDKASDNKKDNTVATNKADDNDKNNTPNDTTTTKPNENKTNKETSREIDGNNVAAKVYRESSLVNDKGVVEGDTRSMMKPVSSPKAVEMNDEYDVFKGEDFKQLEQQTQATDDTNENVLPETGSSSNDTAKTATFLSLISGLGLLLVGKRRKQDSK